MFHSPSRIAFLAAVGLVCVTSLAGCPEEDGVTVDGSMPDTGVPEFFPPEPPSEPPACDCPPEHPCVDGVCDCSETNDHDGDGVASMYCFNAAGKPGTDCDDANARRSPALDEVCDGIDNDCDGFVDESDEEPSLSGGLESTFVPDLDLDTFGDPEAEPVFGCAQILRRPNWVPFEEAVAAPDLDDENPRVYPGAPEICDGVDNDGEGGVDAEDPRYVQRDIEFTQTDVDCKDGRFDLTCLDEDWLWCPERTYCADGADWCEEKWNRGCAPIGNRLSSCRGCDAQCQFRCGEDPDPDDDVENGCDEIVELSGGASHTCARTSQGLVACWGRGSQGQVGNDSTAARTTPVEVEALRGVKALASGGDTTCAIAGERSTVYCWGRNDMQQTGTFEPTPLGFLPYPAPVQVGASGFAHPSFDDGYAKQVFEAAVALDVAVEHACGINEVGALLCWGNPKDGRLAEGPRSDMQTASVVVAPGPQGVGAPIWAQYDDAFVTDARSVALGGDFGCIVQRSGGVACWGNNDDGQLGFDPGELSSSSTVQAVPGVGDVRELAVGESHVCALTDEGVSCWGANRAGQLGRSAGAAGASFEPASIEPQLDDVVQLRAGALFTCALTAGREVYCWGGSDRGSLGTTDSTVPVQRLPLPDGVEPHALFALSEGVCVQGEDAQLWCMGQNDFGQLGLGHADFEPLLEAARLQPIEGSLD